VDAPAAELSSVHIANRPWEGHVTGIVSIGVYLPYNRLSRETIGAALGVPAGKGTRAVASFDEDATTLGVEAARNALASSEVSPSSVLFATSVPTYLDKTNATAIHAGLDLPTDVAAFDMLGSVHSGVGALHAGLSSQAPALVVLSDIRMGNPGGADESGGGDGAVAILTGTGDRVIAEFIGGATATDEFLERWRHPGDQASRVWEERFGEDAYIPLAEQAWGDALKNVGLTPTEIDHVILTGTHPRSIRAFARSTGANAEAFVDDLSAVTGNTGTAHPGLLLATVLEKAKPGETIAMIVLADGVDVLLFKATDAIANYAPANTVQDQIASQKDGLDYQKFLTWRGFLKREPPRRPDPLSPDAPPAHRYKTWKFSFTGSTCEACGMRHLPPQDVCASCSAVRQMKPERMSDVRATITTFTIDRLAFSESPPKVAAVLDFDGGGRYRAELTDVDPDTVAIGNRVEMTFRRLFESHGIVNYHWKARPIRGGN
jgi:hydroxymethylglutaryl-CoA synthase